MIEVLFFALVAGYLFFRLWSVLGTRTGHERPRENIMGELEEDNVIIMPKRQAQGQDSADGNVTTVSYGPYAYYIERIHTIEPDFDLDEFEEKAQYAYKMIVDAFNANDLSTLEMLLEQKVLKEFKKAIEARQNLGHTVKNEFVGNVACTTDAMDIEGDQAYITLKIQSQQRLVTYDKMGEIIDNVDESVVRLTEYWTFTRKLGSNDPTWLLSKTNSKPH